MDDLSQVRALTRSRFIADPAPVSPTTQIPVQRRARPLVGRFDRVLQTLLGLAIIAGVIGAFVQLDRSSLWYDELFTAWVTTKDADPTHVFGRILTDLHPPLYYFSTYLWSLLFGAGDADLRAYSAVCAVAAVAVVFFGLKPRLSLQGRLVAAALATGSREWFYMAQNARSYALCMLLGAVLLWLAVELLRDRGARRWPLYALFAVSVAGAFSHFFMTFEAVGLCLMLAVYAPRRRIALLGFAGALVVANDLYLTLVVDRFARFSLTHTWMSNRPVAYAGNVLESLKLLGLREIAIVGLLAWGCMALWRLAMARFSRRAGATPAARGLDHVRAADPVAVICAAVPVLVFVFSVLSSQLIRPNFTPQNFLICAPFIWGLCGRLYDRAVARAGPRGAIAIKAVAGLFLVSAAFVVAGRFVERNEPWKESAIGVRGFAACQGQVVPVVSEDGPYLRDARFPDLYRDFFYGRYLDGFAPVAAFEHTDIAAGRLSPDMRALLAARLSGQGCPILAWDTHTDDAHYAATLMQQIAAAAGPPGPGLHLAKIEYPFYGKAWTGQTTKNPAFILYVSRGG